MPSRSILNKTRGQGRGALPKIGKLGRPPEVTEADGRANTNAGHFERQANGQDVPSEGYVVQTEE